MVSISSRRICHRPPQAAFFRKRRKGAAPIIIKPPDDAELAPGLGEGCGGAWPCIVLRQLSVLFLLVEVSRNLESERLHQLGDVSRR